MKIAVVAHTARAVMAGRLADDVDADFVSFDNGTRGCRGNHRHTWQHLAEKYVLDDEWAIVIEDDAVPVADFRAQTQAALDVAPTEVVSLYLGKLRPPQWMRERVPQAVCAANRDDASWIRADIMLHAVGIAVRGRALIEKMLWATKNFRRPIDEEFSMWSRRFNHPIAYTWPSLVDHADAPPAIEFTTDGEIRGPGRVAWRIGTRERWTGRSAILRSGL